MKIELPTNFRVIVEYRDAENLNNKLDQILMKVSESLAILKEASVKLKEAAQEINEKLSDLTSTDPDISPEGQQIIQDIKESAKALADVVPDKAVEGVPAPTPEPAPAEPAPAPPEGEQPPA